MSTSPELVIYVRHSPKCKHSGDEYARRCNCRKYIRGTYKGKRYRVAAGTRSWAEAEAKMKDFADQLAGKTPLAAVDGTKDLAEAVALFIQDKRVAGISEGVLQKYERELARMRSHLEASGVYVVQGITRENLIPFCATWENAYPSSQTRAMVRARLRGFLSFCYDNGWLARVPQVTKVKVEEPPTLPLTAAEFDRLLNAPEKPDAPGPLKARSREARVLFLLMRYSGLALGDSLKLPRNRLKHDNTKGLHRVVTARQKTGTDVSVPVPPFVAEALLSLPGDVYFFWNGSDDIVKTFTKYVVAPAFNVAKIPDGGSMKSHRLRDTFAVDLLEKGVPLEEVSKLLGHESIKTTERHYAKWVKGRQDRLDSLVMGTWV